MQKVHARLFVWLFHLDLFGHAAYLLNGT